MPHSRYSACMTLSRRIAAAVAILAVSLVSALAVASPASAAPPSSCTNSSLCSYVAQQFSTSQGYELNPVQSPGTCDNVGLPNSWTSVYNNSGRSVRMYKNPNCSGGVWTLASGDSLRNMSLYQPSWNDTIDSIRW